MTKQWDAVVIGGGHNGLVAAAYLARAGLDTLVLERRGVIGGASVSEHPFGPEYTVTSLSYVLSLLPPDIAHDLRLDLTVYPQGPYFAPRRDGRALRLPADAARRHEEIARFSSRDADAYDAYEAHLAGIARVVAPLLEQVPPRLGSRRPADLLAQARLAARLRTVDVRGAVDITRLFTGSIADLLDRYFESDALRGVLSVSGVIGTWAGPRSAGTAYVMLHHHVGEAGGQSGAWGFPRGGMGAVAAAIAASARGFGATVRTDAEVGRIRVRDGAVAGVTLASGEEIDASCVVTTAHPAISFLRLLDRAELPAGFAADIEHWQTRSGTVKINLALDRLPVFTAHPSFDPAVHGGTIVLSESLDDVENAFQEAVGGKPATLPFADICIPSVFDDSLAPSGQHVMSMFTQWVPDTLRGRARRGRAGRLRGPGDRAGGGGRARVHRLGAAPAGHRAARDAGGVRPGRRQHLPRRAVARAAVPRPARGRLRGPAHTGARAVPGGVGDARGRRGHRDPRAQRGAADSRRPARRALAPPPAARFQRLKPGRAESARRAPGWP